MKLSRKRYLDQITAETVVVNTRDGNSIRGALVGVYADSIVLKGAAFLGTGGDDVKIDGEAVIPTASVEWIQRPGGSS